MNYRKIAMLTVLLFMAVVLVGCGGRTYPEEKGIKNDGVFNYLVVENTLELTHEDEFGEEYIEIVQDDFIQIVNLVKQAKHVSIPDTIEGLPVRVISEMAFFEYVKFLGLMTFSTSKLETIELPNTLQTINRFAFYQARNLTRIEIPASVRTIGESAFASVTGLKELVIHRNEPDYIWYTSESMHANPIIISGARSAYVGDIYRLTASEGVTWSSSNVQVATINQDTGRVQFLRTGTVTFTATSRATGPVRTAMVTVQIFSETKTLRFQDKSFDRMNSLETLTLHIKNPNVLDLNVGELKLTTGVRIYVPATSVDFYKNHAVWRAYESQIFPIE